MISFMGSLGTMMKGSGFKEALGCVYGPNAVTHMMSGKAVSRALRGHFLLEGALTNKLLLKVWPSNENEIGTDVEDINIAVHNIEATDTEKISHLYDGIQSKVLSIDAVCESEELCKLEQCLLE